MRFRFLISSIVCIGGLALAGAPTARASEDALGFVNNDGSKLTMLLDAPAVFPLDDDPEIPVLPGTAKGFGFLYFGAGFTHDFDPSILWVGTPTDVALEITGLVHDGMPVATGFQIASGELGAFDDIYVNGIAPTNRVGLSTPALVVTSDMILDAQNGDPNDPPYENHAHAYLEADAGGIWDVTFVLRDVADTRAYQDSDPFTVRFEATPEPTSVWLILVGATLAVGRLRNR